MVYWYMYTFFFPFFLVGLWWPTRWLGLWELKNILCFWVNGAVIQIHIVPGNLRCMCVFQAKWEFCTVPAPSCSKWGYLTECQFQNCSDSFSIHLTWNVAGHGEPVASFVQNLLNASKVATHDRYEQIVQYIKKKWTWSSCLLICMLWNCKINNNNEIVSDMRQCWLVVQETKKIAFNLGWCN